MTRIFFATDLHGSEICFKKFVNAAKFYNADILILGGDLTGKVIVPIIEQNNGTFKADVIGSIRIARTKEELQQIEKDITNSGYYASQLKEEEYKQLSENPEKLKDLFLEMQLKVLRRWINMAEEKLKGTNVGFYVTGGNDDPIEIEKILDSSNVVTNSGEKLVQINAHHEMISSGYSNMTPWKCPRDIPEETLAEIIDKMASQVKNMKNCIFNLHVPPYNSGIDSAPRLDKDLKPVYVRGEPEMIPVGSTAVRAAIEKYQPLLGLHGHIHESKGSIKIGQTLCLNPGSEYYQWLLKGILVNLDEKKIKGYQFISG